MSNMAEGEFYPWTERKLSILKKHEEYHKYMVDYIQGLIREGSTSFPPKKLTTSLPVTFKKSNKLLGGKSDEYLKKNLTSNFGPALERSKVRTFESFKSDLVKCAEYEKTLKKVNLKFILIKENCLMKFTNYGLRKRLKDQ